MKKIILIFPHEDFDKQEFIESVEMITDNLKWNVGLKSATEFRSEDYKKYFEDWKSTLYKPAYFLVLEPNGKRVILSHVTINVDFKDPCLKDYLVIEVNNEIKIPW